mmetsp:Transcript_34205/g.61076  ORF Transcript_34205/g.61076 Transcript_34205/m.61076 type:complete len:219 (+) Transcript_34205:144-800(+)
MTYSINCPLGIPAGSGRLCRSQVKIKAFGSSRAARPFFPPAPACNPNPRSPSPLSPQPSSHPPHPPPHPAQAQASSVNSCKWTSPSPPAAPPLPLPSMNGSRVGAALCRLTSECWLIMATCFDSGHLGARATRHTQITLETWCAGVRARPLLPPGCTRGSRQLEAVVVGWECGCRRPSLTRTAPLLSTRQPFITPPAPPTTQYGSSTTSPPLPCSIHL